MSTIVVSNFATGYETDRPAFEINNDAFPLVSNAYIWRGRILKKRGVTQLGRLTRDLQGGAVLSTQANGATYSNSDILADSAFNLRSSQPNAQLVPGTITITVGSVVFTDPLKNGILSAVGGSGVINYATAALSLSFAPPLGGLTNVSVQLDYYSALPVMGIRQFNRNFNVPGNINFPLTVFLDTKYSYLFTQTTGPFYDVNFFVGSALPFLWSGTDYQQFWTTNYQGAMWTTNNVPGFNFLNIATISVGAVTTITTTNPNPIVTGDIVFFNEVTGTDANLLNLQTAVATHVNSTTFTVPITTTGKTINNSGIFQMLTNTIVGQDGIKYFIGDPVGDNTKGWVNFSPPLSSAATPSYLVGAKIIVPFKNRLLFFGTWTQTSGGSPIYNPNQLVSCQNGTVFYANGGLPPNQTADPTSFYQNVVGKGLRLNAPYSQEVITASVNEDAIIVIFENIPLRLYSTGDDSAPFLYQTISSEYGALSTFSAIPLDEGVLSISPYGFTMTDQRSTQRIDLKIPDEVFNINQGNNGINRVTAVRDFRNEFVYFTFPTNANYMNNANQINWIYPTTTLAFNYRDNLWSTFTENYTTYGTFRYSSGYTWATLPFRTWSSWTNPWNFGSTQTRYPFIACGNQQGFILLKQETTREDQSEFISAISGNTITSPNHCLNNGDYILIQNCLGDATITAINGQIYQISVDPTAANTFTLLPVVGQPVPSGTYLGNGTFSRLTNINIQTKQFPVFWQDSRQTRIGTQKYLLENTPRGQLTVNLLVSQNVVLSANDPQYSAYLPFSNVLFTSYEGSDLNQMQVNQDQIWHRINTSVIGDTVQLAFNLSDAQMRNINANQEEITLFAFILTVYPGPPLAI